VRGFTQAVLEDYAPCLDDVAVDYLERVVRATQRMDQLVNDLLMLARLTGAELRVEPVDLSRMASAIASELQRNHAGRAVDFRIAPAVEATGDARLLRIAMENLLQNAWKFTGRSDRPCIEFGTENVAGVRTFFVRDNGAGFDMRHADKLFAVFQRLHSASDFPGTGIGLATVHRIVRRHHGRIWADAAVNRGATFYFTLGASQAAARPAKAASTGSLHRAGASDGP
jgi:light-regulated signal transduction histidine kinase (bacteriophytochrome)